MTFTTPLDELFNKKLTENGDDSYVSTGSNLVDLLFQAEYFSKHLDEVHMDLSHPRATEFASFMRNPRNGGMGYRDLGRVLMNQVNMSSTDKAISGRFDDLLKSGKITDLKYAWDCALEGNELAKKWFPRLNAGTTARAAAKDIVKKLGISEREYRKVIKLDSTVEYKLSHKQDDQINFSHVPTMAMLKYWKRFKLDPRFEEYLESVKKGEAKINFSVGTAYDIYKNSHNVDADLLFSKLPECPLSVIPVLDTSASMEWGMNDAAGKALAIAHFLGKNSTYAPNQVVSFSSEPKLMKISGHNYRAEISSMHTGDCSNTDLKEVFNLLSRLKSFPEFIVVLSDMEFDSGSLYSYDELNKYLDEQGIATKVVWWNFNGRNRTTPELNVERGIFMSGYSPQLLGLLEAGFNMDTYLNKVLDTYSLATFGEQGYLPF